MATLTTYRCDRCGVEVKRKSQLRWFNAQLGEDIERKAAGGRTILVEMEVCGDCAAELSSAISAAMEARGAV